MSSSRLTFRLTLAPNAIRIAANGCLDRATAHLLCKVVVATLRRFSVSRLELDLTAVTRIDAIGVDAIRVSRRETLRHGADFAVAGPARQAAVRRRPRATTGTICLRPSGLSVTGF